MMNKRAEVFSVRSEITIILSVALLSILILAPFTLQLRHEDDGIFIQDALLMSDGFKLYHDIPQGVDPLPFWTLEAVFRTFGPSFLAMRVVFIAMIVIAVPGVYYLSRIGGLLRLPAALAAILFPLSVPPFFSYSHHWQATCLAIVGVALFLSAVWRGHPKRAFFSGVCLGLMVHTHIVTGAILAAACAAWIALESVLAPLLERRLYRRLSGWWLGGLFVTLAVVPVIFFISGSFPDYYRNVILRKLSYAEFQTGVIPYGRTSLHAYSFAELLVHPTLAMVYLQQSLMLLLPFLVLIGGVWQFIYPHHRGPTALNPGNFVILCGLAMMGSILYSPAPYKIPTVVILCFPALGIVLQRSTGHGEKGYRLASLILMACVALYGVKTAGMIWASAWDSLTIPTSLGRVKLPPGRDAEDIIALREYFASQEKGICAFVYPYGPHLYFLCGLSNPTRFSNIRLDCFNEEDLREIRRILEGSPRCAIVVIHNEWGGSPSMKAWIQRNYRKEAVFDRFDVWRSSLLAGEY